MNKFRMYIASTIIAVAVTLISASLMEARPKGGLTPKEKACDDAVIACLNACILGGDQTLYQGCQSRCWVRWNKCNGYAARPRPPITMPAGGVKEQKTTSKATPTPSASATPKARAKEKAKG